MRTFTLIVCTRNRAESLARCLDALDFTEIREERGEVVVVDNGSTDDTPQLLARFAAEQQGELFKALVERNTGKCFALNTGIRHARGEVLAFTDDDCYVQRGYFRELVRAFVQHDIDYCTGRILLHDPSDARRAVNYSSVPREFPPCTPLPTGAVQGANMAFRRRVFERAGLFDVRWCTGEVFACEDIDMAARASAAGFRGAFLPQLVVRHHHGRKPGSAELAATVKAYDVGRGAYYASRVLAGDWRYLRLWLTSTVRRRRSPRTILYESAGALRCVRARLRNAR